MLYVKVPTELNGAFILEEAKLNDYIKLIPNDIKLKLAEMHLHDQINQGDAYTNPGLVKHYISTKVATKDREVFGVLVLDNQHRLITDKILFKGSISSSSVYPREVVKLMLENSGASCIFYHNHPSGDPTPSEADKRITKRLKDALELIDCSVLDHIITGVEGQYSFAESGLI